MYSPFIQNIETQILSQLLIFWLLPPLHTHLAIFINLEEHVTHSY